MAKYPYSVKFKWASGEALSKLSSTQTTQAHRHGSDLDVHVYIISPSR